MHYHQILEQNQKLCDFSDIGNKINKILCNMTQNDKLTKDCSVLETIINTEIFNDTPALNDKTYSEKKK